MTTMTGVQPSPMRVSVRVCVCVHALCLYLCQRYGRRVSGQGELHRGLPDVRVMEPLSRHHELDRLRQVGHLLLGVHGAVAPHAEVGVAAHEAHLPVVLMAVLKPHCTERDKQGSVNQRVIKE